MTLALAKLDTSILTADARQEGETIAVQLAGTADTQARSELDGYIKKLHDEAVRLAAKAIIVDLRELEFMNSSCFKILVAWLAQLRDLPADKQYRIQIRSNPKLLWQRRSLAALSCFAVDLVTIET